MRRFCLIALLASPTPLWAQNGDEPPAPDDKGILVTSLRSDQALEGVAASVSVFVDPQKSGLSDLRDIANNTPNFAMTDNYRPGLERFQLRGIITPQVGDPPLGFVVDGVTLPDPELAVSRFFDVERVEVLRGAQGALYGRSAVGGVINIITREPTDRLSARVDTSLENAGTLRLSGSVSGPVADDRVHVRIGAYRDHGDGWVENDYLDRGADYFDDFGLTAKAEIELSAVDRLDVQAMHRSGTSGIGYYEGVAPTREAIENFAIPTEQNVLGVNDHNVWSAWSTYRRELGLGDFSLTGAYFRVQDEGIADGDLTALPADRQGFAPSWQRAVDRLEAFSAEARLTSPRDDRPVLWGLGAYFLQRDKFSSFAVYDDPDGTAPLSESTLANPEEQFSIVDEQLSRTWALSGQLEYRIDGGVTLALAGRFDRDERRSVDPRDPSATRATATYEQFQPKLSLGWQASSQAQLYANYSRGFRSGGFNQYSPDVARSFPAETTDSFELGVRSSLLDGKLKLSAALFRNEQSNAQITRFNPNTFTLENVAIDEVTATGGEIEWAWSLAPSLRWDFAVGYTSSEIEAYAAIPSVVGYAMPYVPEYTLSTALRYERDLGQGGSFWVLPRVRLIGPRSFNLEFPDLRSDAHGFFDLTAGYDRSAWTLSAFAENLLDERQPEDVFGVFNGPVELARQPNRGRIFGLRLGYRFERAR